jgi:hypothetical protein
VYPEMTIIEIKKENFLSFNIENNQEFIPVWQSRSDLAK